jgi:non-ribosomal peptide synthetase component F
LIKVLKSGVSAFLEYRTSFIPTDHAKNIASTLDKIFSELLTSSETQIGKANFFSDRNRIQTERWNDRPLEYVHRTIHEVIADNIEKNPNDEAVCSWDGTLTYQQLSHHASKLASYLQDVGVGPEVIVPLCFEKSKWNVVAMLGVLIAGGACKLNALICDDTGMFGLEVSKGHTCDDVIFPVARLTSPCSYVVYERLHYLVMPLDPAAPKERKQQLIAATNAKIILCSRAYVEILEGVSEKTTPIDTEFPDSLRMEALRLDVRAESHNLAYVIPTSGTTGQPKLTIIEHGNFCAGMKGHVPGLLMDAAKPLRALQFAAHSFDASITELLTPLMIGGTICIPDEQSRLNDIASAINDMRVTWAQLTPTFVRFLIPSMIPTLATIVLMGEAMSQKDLDIWNQINLVNGYGTSFHVSQRLA